jgi:hypothetical protein
MLREAAVAGVYHSPLYNRDYPRVQILTIAELLAGAEIKMPPTEVGTLKKAPKVEGGEDDRQLGLPM